MNNQDKTDSENSPNKKKQRQLEVLDKLRPYLRGGLSVKKACLEADVPKSTAYDWMSKDKWFLDQINRDLQFLSVLGTNAVVAQLHDIIQKQNEMVKVGGREHKQELNKEDIKFLKWFVTNSSKTREEFSPRQEIVASYDPEVEYQRITELLETAPDDVGLDETPENTQGEEEPKDDEPEEQTIEKNEA